MRYRYDYHRLDNDEYYQITLFEESESKVWKDGELSAAEVSRGEVHVEKFEISQALFRKILDFLEAEKIRTRDPAPSSFMDGTVPYSFTVYSLKFALHAVKGKRGGWFIIENGGREPFIEDEFIAFGAMRKSGTRRGRYRRNLSQTEKAQVEWLDSRTPTIKKIYEWVTKKYPAEVKKVRLHFRNDDFSS